MGKRELVALLEMSLFLFLSLLASLILERVSFEILKKKIFLMSRDCWCSVALPHRAVGLSAVPLLKKLVSMIRKYHNYTPQTNTWHREDT